MRKLSLGFALLTCSEPLSAQNAPLACEEAAIVIIDAQLAIPFAP
jgi:hypothetical protein